MQVITWDFGTHPNSVQRVLRPANILDSITRAFTAKIKLKFESITAA